MVDEDATLPPAFPGLADEGVAAGAFVGPYRLVRKLGEGGFGEVYEAEQTHPIRRQVALKLIRPGMESREIAARFDAERQALALMEHPHIARVIDAGATERGLPYFVMELVDGVPITRYCNTHRLTVPQRLALFEQVCQAVQHAHSKGVIHRDLKPGNVLVATQDGHGFARVIDFGIARAVAGTSDATRYTLEQQLIGTPVYMSPEQAEGSADIDTRSDIYALGVMLYELLTGDTPLDALSVRSAALAEMQRVIREVDPPLPSAHLGQSLEQLRSAALRCRTDPRTLGRQVRGELDWIVMKALEKERARRYGSASEFGQDVRRYLDGEQVLAAPPSLRYRLGKFVRRNRLLVGAGSAVAASLVVGLALAAWQARIATQRADQLEEVTQFQAAMFDRLDTSELGHLLDETVRQLRATPEDAGAVAAPVGAVNFDDGWAELDKVAAASRFLTAAILAPAAESVKHRYLDQPLVEARLTDAMAGAYAHLGDYGTALALRQRQRERSRVGGDVEDVLGASVRIGELQRLLGEYEPAEKLLRDLLDECDGTLGERFPAYCIEAAGELASLLQDQMRLEEAEPLYRRALAAAERQFGPDDEEVGQITHNLGYLLMNDGRLDEAEPLLRRSLDITLASSSVDSAKALSSRSVLATLSLNRGDFAAAEAGYRHVLEGRFALKGNDHPDTSQSSNDLGVALHQLGRTEEAVPYFERAWRGFQAHYGPDHIETLSANNNLCVLMSSLGRFDDAAPFCLQASTGLDALFGDDNATAITAANNLAALHLNRGDAAAAEALLLPRLDAARTAFTGDRSLILGRLLLNLGRARLERGDAGSAAGLVDEAGAIIDAAPAATDRDRDRLAKIRASLATTDR